MTHPSNPSLFSPLRIRTYRTLFFAQVISLFGTGLTTIALALLAYQLAGEKAGQLLGAVLGLKMIAYVFVAPIVSSIINRLPRKSLLISLDIARALAVACLPFVSEVWQVFVLVFLVNVMSAGFTPVFQALIPDIVTNKAQYDRALALSRLAYDLENLLSPVLATVLVSLISFTWLFAMNALAFCVSAVLVFIVTVPVLTKFERRPFFTQALFGSRLYLRTPRLRGALALVASVAFIGGMQIVNTVLLVKTELELSDAWVAIFFGTIGAGSMLAALSIPALLKQITARTIMLTGGLILPGSMLAVALFQPSLSLLLPLWFLTGVGASLIQTPVGKLLVASCHEEDRTAVFAAQFSLSHACWLFAYVIAGWLGAAIGLYSAFLVASLLALVSTSLAFTFWPKKDEPIQHTHPAVKHQHLHTHDEHHQHDHEGWEGPEPHAHPHQHSKITHTHWVVIDQHHVRWPTDSS